MDLATIAGLIVGVVAIFMTITLDNGLGALNGFFNIPSIFLVLGGGLASTMVSYKLNDFLRVIKIVSNIFTSKENSKDDMIRNLVELSNKARREGLLALEADQGGIDDEFVKQSLQLVVDGVEPSTIREFMELELTNLEGRHLLGRSMLRTMASQFPSWGMMGTVIGLINMLGALEDPSTIGPAMAMALITTLYGSFLANYICIPAAEKLSVLSRNEIQLKEMIIEGILSIQAGENPRIMEHKLKTFLSPDQKTRYEELANTGGGGAAAGAA